MLPRGLALLLSTAAVTVECQVTAELSVKLKSSEKETRELQYLEAVFVDNRQLQELDALLLQRQDDQDDHDDDDQANLESFGDVYYKKQLVVEEESRGSGGNTNETAALKAHDDNSHSMNHHHLSESNDDDSNQDSTTAAAVTAATLEKDVDDNEGGGRGDAVENNDILAAAMTPTDDNNNSNNDIAEEDYLKSSDTFVEKGDDYDNNDSVKKNKLEEESNYNVEEADSISGFVVESASVTSSSSSSYDNHVDDDSLLAINESVDHVVITLTAAASMHLDDNSEDATDSVSSEIDTASIVDKTTNTDAAVETDDTTTAMSEKELTSQNDDNVCTSSSSDECAEDKEKNAEEQDEAVNVKGGHGIAAQWSDFDPSTKNMMNEAVSDTEEKKEDNKYEEASINGTSIVDYELSVQEMEKPALVDEPLGVSDEVSQTENVIEPSISEVESFGVLDVTVLGTGSEAVLSDEYSPVLLDEAVPDGQTEEASNESQKESMEIIGNDENVVAPFTYEADEVNGKKNASSEENFPEAYAENAASSHESDGKPVVVSDGLTLNQNNNTTVVRSEKQEGVESTSSFKSSQKVTSFENVVRPSTDDLRKLLRSIAPSSPESSSAENSILKSDNFSKTPKLEHQGSNEANAKFVTGLDDFDKFMEKVEVPDELDVGASGSSIQEILVQQTSQIIIKRVANGVQKVRSSIKKIQGSVRRRLDHVAVSLRNKNENFDKAFVLFDDAKKKITYHIVDGWKKAQNAFYKIVAIIDGSTDDDNDDVAPSFDFDSIRSQFKQAPPRIGASSDNLKSAGDEPLDISSLLERLKSAKDN